MFGGRPVPAGRIWYIVHHSHPLLWEGGLEPVRLGFLGLGWWGGVLAAAARASGAAEVVASFSNSPEKRAAFVERHGGRSLESVDAVLAAPEVEGVVIATPHSTHGDLIEAAAAAGKHVFVEKPLTLTVASGKRAIRATEHAGVILQVGHNRRRQPANRRIKAMIDSGELGRIVMLEGNQSSPAGNNPKLVAWRRDPREAPVGGMTGNGIHLVDDFDYFVGHATRLFAFSKKLDSPLPLDEVTAVVIEYASGPLGYIGTSAFTSEITDLTVYGKEAVAWNIEEGSKLYVQRRDEDERHRVEVETIDTVADELAEFATGIRTGSQPETGGPEGLEAVAVLEAIQESARTGRPAELQHFR